MALAGPIDRRKMPAFELALVGWNKYGHKRSDELIKWIKAPTVAVVRRFVELRRLKPMYGIERLQPSYFDKLGHAAGIDVILNRDAKIVSGTLGITRLPPARKRNRSMLNGLGASRPSENAIVLPGSRLRRCRAARLPTEKDAPPSAAQRLRRQLAAYGSPTKSRNGWTKNPLAS